MLPVLTVRTGAKQFHDRGTVFAGPMKVKVALAGQLVSGIEMVTCAVWPGVRLPLCELRVIPLAPLLVALQFRLLRFFASLFNVAVQLQPWPVL